MTLGKMTIWKRDVKKKVEMWQKKSLFIMGAIHMKHTYSHYVCSMFVNIQRLQSLCACALVVLTLLQHFIVGQCLIIRVMLIRSFFGRQTTLAATLMCDLILFQISVRSVHSDAGNLPCAYLLINISEMQNLGLYPIGLAVQRNIMFIYLYCCSKMNNMHTFITAAQHCLKVLFFPDCNK